MLRDAQMAGLVKLHCGKGVISERQEWAESGSLHKGRGADVLCICEPRIHHQSEPTFKQTLFRGYLYSAAVRSEPILLDAAWSSNVCLAPSNGIQSVGLCDHRGFNCLEVASHCKGRCIWVGDLDGIYDLIMLVTVDRLEFIGCYVAVGSVPFSLPLHAAARSCSTF